MLKGKSASVQDLANYSIDPKTWATFAFVQQVINGLPDPIFAKDLQHRIVAGNQAFGNLIGRSHDEMLGLTDADFASPEQAAQFMQMDDLVMEARQPNVVEEQLTNARGEHFWLWTRKFPLYNPEGDVIGLCGIITDITELTKRKAEITQLEQDLAAKAAIISMQTELLDQLAVPIIQIWDGVVLLPLVGSLDSRHVSRVLEQMLESIGRLGAQFLILDITGVPVVDTAVARYLIRSVQAAQLLGCNSILVGISPEIAQTLVGLGVDFSRIMTLSTLQSGLNYALRQLNYSIQLKG